MYAKKNTGWKLKWVTYKKSCLSAFPTVTAVDSDNHVIKKEPSSCSIRILHIFPAASFVGRHCTLFVEKGYLNSGKYSFFKYKVECFLHFMRIPAKFCSSKICVAVIKTICRVAAQPVCSSKRSCPPVSRFRDLSCIKFIQNCLASGFCCAVAYKLAFLCWSFS